MRKLIMAMGAGLIVQLLSLTANSAVFRCNDEKGSVIYTDRQCAGHAAVQEFSAAQRKRVPLNNVEADNKWIEAIRSPSGIYYVDGMLSGNKATFQVDTGSSMTAIPKSMADLVKDCRPNLFHSALGEVAGCIGRIDVIELGQNRFQNVEVALLPDLKTPLLGMDLINRFKIEQSGKGMRLTAKTRLMD